MRPVVWRTRDAGCRRLHETATLRPLRLGLAHLVRTGDRLPNRYHAECEKMSERSGWLSIFGRRISDSDAKPLPGPITVKSRRDLAGADTAPTTAKSTSMPAPITVESLAAEQKAKTARPRLVFAVDATSSRQAAWDTAKRLTDRLLAA